MLQATSRAERGFQSALFTNHPRLMWAGKPTQANGLLPFGETRPKNAVLWDFALGALPPRQPSADSMPPAALPRWIGSQGSPKPLHFTFRPPTEAASRRESAFQVTLDLTMHAQNV
jgi:hypothetical protein